jgi:hypothetical protein
MFKKGFTIFCAVLYLCLSSGIMLSAHYCGGKLKNISFLTHPDNDSCCGSKKMSKDCCKDAKSFLKVKDSHKLSASISITNQASKNFQTNGLPSLLLSYLPISVKSEIFHQKVFDPPVISSPPIFIELHRIVV